MALYMQLFIALRSSECTLDIVIEELKSYNDFSVVRFAKKLYPMGAFGFECTLNKVIEELKSYNDFSIHRVIILDPVNVSFYFVMYLKI